VLILAGGDDPVCPLPIAEASASWGWPGRVGDLLSGRSRVRVAVGTQIMQLDTDIRNYECSVRVLLAGNHSI